MVDIKLSDEKKTLQNFCNFEFILIVVGGSKTERCQKEIKFQQWLTFLKILQFYTSFDNTLVLLPRLQLITVFTPIDADQTN